MLKGEYIKMFKIVSRNADKFGVQDSDDGVVEYYTISELQEITQKTGIKIMGLTNILKVGVIQESDIQSLFDDFFRLMKRESAYFDSQQDIMNGYACVRDWGDWSAPKSDENFDFEDYDWKVLKPEWKKVLKNVSNELKKRYPNIKFYISPEEKNWIGLQIEG
jgi:hypothetical protein